ncbi:COG2746 Aminoglycoside N3'-acetyltransferase [Candidatus Nanopelagicaceae bacterium]
MKNPLSGYWANSGINHGDTVLIHSSMRRTFMEIVRRGHKATSEVVIDSLLQLVGPNGTIIFPLFNFDFPESRRFSILTTPSQMGRVTEDARTKFEGSRTGHPIYSFYAIGENEKYFSGIDNFSGYGSDSPFSRLRELDGKIACIDLDDQQSMTFYHHVEEMCEVDYRYHKIFEGEYTDKLGNSSLKQYSLFVRNLNRGISTDVNRMGDILWREKLYQGSLPNTGNGLRSIPANIMFERTKREIIEGRALETLYSIDS